MADAARMTDMQVHFVKLRMAALEGTVATGAIVPMAQTVVTLAASSSLSMSRISTASLVSHETWMAVKAVSKVRIVVPDGEVQSAEEEADGRPCHRGYCSTHAWPLWIFR
jgi:hypothetical protein